MSDFILQFTPYFKKSALREISKVDEKAVELKKFTDGVCLVSSVLAQEVFFERLLSQRPIFIKHVAPASKAVKLSGEKEKDQKLILDTVLKLKIDIKNVQKFCVQTRIVTQNVEKPSYTSKDMEVFIGGFFEKAGGIPTFDFSKISPNEKVGIFSIFVFNNEAHVGFSSEKENLNFDCDEYRSCSRLPKKVSRAENKLAEALKKFGIKTSSGKLALDVGASPGGWTNVLVLHGFKVVAVDPGALHLSLQNHPQVVYLRCKVEAAVFNQKFDLIVNDMNVDPKITGEIMNKLAKHLKPKGEAIVTLKLPGNPEKGVEEGVLELSKKYKVKNVASLFHNRREVTAFIQKK